MSTLGQLYDGGQSVQALRQALTSIEAALLLLFVCLVVLEQQQFQLMISEISAIELVFEH